MTIQSVTNEHACWDSHPLKTAKGGPASPKTPSWMRPWLEQGKVPPGYNVDHIKALSAGGLDDPSNMRLVLAEDHGVHHSFYHPWR
jgi:hypothetical protein